MNFLQQNCRFGFYTQGKAALCKSFKCGDNVSELALIFRANIRQALEQPSDVFRFN